MVRATKELTGLDARQLAFDELDFTAEFDGIWACASLLHVTRRELGSVLAQLARALKPNGVLYMSFKYGDGERVEDGRLFNDMDEARLRDALLNHPLLELSASWVSEDLRNDRGGRQPWLNSIVRRVERNPAPTICDNLLRPTRLWTRDEVLTRPSPVPRAPGVYAWYFRNVPVIVPTADGLRVGEFTLLYVGISPSAPPTNGKPPSRQTLSSRVRYHMRGNAEGSTLRLSLGCLLAEELGIELQQVGSGTRLTFAAGEQQLSEWLEQNARVVWHECAEPWLLEHELIASLTLPLNLDLNWRSVFFRALSEMRRLAKVRARTRPGF
jgi:Methyltransferase domain